MRRALHAAAGIATALLILAACGSDDDSNPAVSPSPEAPAPLPDAGSPAPAAPWQLTLLHINDHHSNLAGQDDREILLKTGIGDERSDVAVSAAGFARVTRAMSVLAEGKPNVLKLHAGDALTGTLYFNRAGEAGEADAALMNTVCFDAFTLGNHEFDKGDSGLKGFLDHLHGGDCRTPVLSANVRFGASSVLSPARAPEAVRPSIVLERGGERIGVIGLTIAAKTKASSSPDPDTTFEDEAIAAQREIDRLKADGVNKIIVMSHIGYEYDQRVIAKLTGVDVVVGGDSHTLLGPDRLTDYGVGTPAGDYPTLAHGADGKLVCLVQAWEYSQVVGELRVSFDERGDVLACEGRPHVLIDSDYRIGGAPVTDVQRTAIEADIAASGFLYRVQEDSAAAALLATYTAQINVFNETDVALATEELCLRRVPGGAGTVDYGRSSATCNAVGDVSLRGGDTQQLVAQAYLEVARRQYGGAEISLQSGGGVRVPLLPGPVSAARVIEMLPFGNLLYRLTLTADEVKAMLEDGLEAVYGPGGSTGPYPYTGGLRFDVDASAGLGSRVSGIEVEDAASGAWVALDPAREYRLFVLSFNATGGDGYETLAAIPSERRLDVGVLDADVFLDYLQTRPVDTATGLPLLGKLPSEVYSTRRYTPPAPPGP